MHICNFTSRAGLRGNRAHICGGWFADASDQDGYFASASGGAKYG